MWMLTWGCPPDWVSDDAECSYVSADSQFAQQSLRSSPDVPAVPWRITLCCYLCLNYARGFCVLQSGR
jgi:hypothetical protein